MKLPNRENLLIAPEKLTNIYCTENVIKAMIRRYSSQIMVSIARTGLRLLAYYANMLESIRSSAGNDENMV